MQEQDKKTEMSSRDDAVAQNKPPHTESSEHHHHRHHHHHHHHSSHHHRTSDTADEKGDFWNKVKRFLRKNRKDLLWIAIIVLVLGAFLIHAMTDTVGFLPDDHSGSTTDQPSASDGTANSNKPQASAGAGRFSKVDAVCDAYSNEAGTVSIPCDKNDSYIDPVNEVYALYDGLVASYPEYVTRTLLGTIIADAESFPLYRYDFKPPMLMGSQTEDMCRILYCSGTHGGEIPPVLQGFRFFKDLCVNWRNQDLLRTLRFNCHFTVIPLVNPYGIQHDQKTNANGVNLNRNFTNEWVFVADDGTTASPYSGETPASELETQWIEAMTASEHFDFGIDHHTFDSLTGSGIAGYFVCNDAARPADASFADLMGNWISAKVVTDNPYVTDLSKSYFKTTAGSRFNGYVFGAFPAGYCFETIFGWGDAKMEAAYECQKFGAEVLGAVFYTAMECYHTY